MIENTMQDLNEIVTDIHKIKNRIRELQSDAQYAEQELVKRIVKHNLHNCLSINYGMLNRIIKSNI